MFADSAYQSEESERYVLEKCDFEEFIIFRGRRGHPLPEEEEVTKTLCSQIGGETRTRLWTNEPDGNGDCPDNRTEARNTA